MKTEMTNNVLVITLDDGKANVVGHALLDELFPALDRAENEAKAVLLIGRKGIFSAGFDLKELQKGPSESKALVSRGYELLYRLYGFPLPVVAACTGHGIGLGAFILLASDSRIGQEGDSKISLPETAISMQLSPLLNEVATSRISKRHIIRSAVQSENYSPELAVDAGFLDELTSSEELFDRALAVATKLSLLPSEYYAKNKLGIRKDSLELMAENLKA
ncbi:MAG: crotonase/enoyl-CoA hydratase family protein [Pseudohongiellaceae bacterium]